MDRAQELTEKRVRRVEARMRKVYSRAVREMREKLAEFEKRHAAMEALNRQLVKEGRMTEREFRDWMNRQVFEGEQWRAKIQQLCDALYGADAAARKIVEGERAAVFAENANYTGYDIERSLRADIGFTLYDAPTVERLLRENPRLLPRAKQPKARSYDWYTRVINGAVTQGILQGESLDKIVRRISAKSAEQSRAALYRHARTAMTGAQNAGRIEGMRQAQTLGVTLKKQWIATLDGRTRDVHGHLDGQTADPDEPFESDLGPIRYPGDMEAAPANFWNCRCSLGWVYPEYARPMTRRDNETGEVFTGTYEEWKAAKRASAENEKSESEKSKDKNNPRRANILPMAEYMGKFSDTVGDQGIESNIARKAQDILRHRNGTPYEDMYLFDAATGKILGAQTHSRAPQQVVYNQSLVSAIKRYGGANMIALHNHPDSLPPSGSDFESLFVHGYKKGFIACHNGTVYEYSVGKKRFSGLLYDMRVAKYRKWPYNMSEEEATLNTLEDFANEYGVKWRRR